MQNSKINQIRLLLFKSLGTLEHTSNESFRMILCYFVIGGNVKLLVLFLLRNRSITNTHLKDIFFRNQFIVCFKKEALEQLGLCISETSVKENDENSRKCHRQLLNLQGEGIPSHFFLSNQKGHIGLPRAKIVNSPVFIKAVNEVINSSYNYFQISSKSRLLCYNQII